MFKVSMAMSVNHGLVDPKLRSKDVSDGQQVNNPVLPKPSDGVTDEEYAGLDRSRCK